MKFTRHRHKRRFLSCDGGIVKDQTLRMVMIHGCWVPAWHLGEQAPPNPRFGLRVIHFPRIRVLEYKKSFWTKEHLEEEDVPSRFITVAPGLLLFQLWLRGTEYWANMVVRP